MTLPQRWAACLTAAGCALGLAACGGAGKQAGSVGSKSFASFLKFSECMRSHGVPAFPDPSPGGGLHIQITGSSGFDPESPAFQQAQSVCRRYLPGGGPPRVVPESVKLELVGHAECMRAHGVPTYPDPRFPKGGGIETFFPSTAALSSPAFQQAAKACGGP